MRQHTWWELLALALGVIGGLKAMADLFDYIYFRKPKISGRILDARVRSIVAPKSRKPAIPSSEISAAFDCELLLFVSAVNLRSQATTVSQWELFGKRKRQTLSASIHKPLSGDSAWLGIKGSAGEGAYIGDVRLRFDQNIENRGWLGFRFEGIRTQEILNAPLKLVAIDSRRRKHVFDSYILRAGNSTLPFSMANPKT